MEKTLVFNNAQQGVNQSRDEIVLGANFQQSGSEPAFPCLWLENMIIDKGTLKRSKGYSVFGGTLTGKTIYKLMNYYGIADNLITVTNDKVYSINPEETIPSTPTAIFTHSNWKDLDFVNYQTVVSGVNKQVLIFGNGVDNVQMWDGTTCADLKAQGYASTAGSTNKAPKGKYLELFSERLWIAGITGEPDTIYCTKAGDPEDFTIPLGELANTAGASFTIPTWDSSKIVGLKTLFGQMLVFKDRHVFRITGSYPGQFSVDEIFNTLNGRVINGTIAGSGDVAFWLATDGLYFYNGSTFTNLTKKMQGAFDLIFQLRIDNAKGFIYDNKYYCWVPTGSSTYPDYLICFDYIDNSFQFYKGFSGQNIVEYKKLLIFCSGDANWYRMFSSDLMGTEQIKSRYESYYFSVGSIKYKKSVINLQILGTGSGTMKVTIQNELGIKKTKEFTLNNILTFIKNLKCKQSGRLMKIIIENVNGCDFDIKQAIINIEVETT